MSRRKLIFGINFLGYSALILQWLWLVIQFMPLILNSEFLYSFSSPDLPAKPVDIPPAIEPVAIVFSIVVITAMLVATVVVLIKAPAKMTKQAESASANVANIVLPKIAPRNITKRRRFKLSQRIQLVIKFYLALVGFAALGFVHLIDEPPLGMYVVWAVGLFLLPWTLFWFGCAYLIATFTNAKQTKKNLD